MDQGTLNALLQALNYSPNNHVLRSQIAKAFFDKQNYEEAKTHYKELLQQGIDLAENKLQLTRCYYHNKETGTAIFICEELLAEDPSGEALLLYAQCLYEDGQTGEAITQYQELLMHYPDCADQELEKKLKIQAPVAEMSEIALADDVFLEKPDVNFTQVGGMEKIKEEIRLKIIHPLQFPDMYKAYGKKIGGGILMYGPPGCGKTFISKATAGEINSKFLSIGLNEILDMWLGNSEKNLNQKFEIARRNTPCVLFFDEIDALGSKRSDLRQSAGRNIINQFLKELDGIESQNEGLLILGATNTPWHMDNAFLRPGRFDRIIFVPPPDEEARVQILNLLLQEKPTDNIDAHKIAAKTKDFSGADLQAVIDIAIEGKLQASFKSGKIELLTTKDLLNAVKRVHPSTKEWFNTAKNYALYSNTSGLYDDILTYLKL